MLSTRIVRFIGGHEGFVSTYYLDPTGTPTIGYGFTWASRVFRDWWMAKYGRKLQRGDTMTKAEAHQVLLKLLLEEYLPPVVRKMPSAPAHVQAPASSMVYNCGAGALGWKWAGAIVRGDIKTAASLWRQTGTTSKGRKLPGLVRRRNEEADIAEFNRWPSWVSDADDQQAITVPTETHTDSVDIKQAQLWLEKLGYELGRADGIVGPRTRSATRSFQKDHGTLKVDGVIGPATLDALQRAIDLRVKAAKATAGGGAVAGAGAAEQVTGASESVPQAPDALGDWLLYGGLALIAIGLLWLAWRYRDELTATLKRL